MAISVGEIFATLTLRDQMTRQLQQAAAQIKTVTAQVSAAATTAGKAGQGMATGITSGVTTATKQLQSLGSALQQAGQHANKSSQTIRDLGSSMRTAGTSLTAGITLPLVGAAGAALKFSNEFESTMVKVHTLSGVAANRIGSMSKEVLDLAKATGVGPTELSKALLVVTSTGLRGAEAMEILTQSARLAAIGLGDAKDSARTITAAMTAYGKETISAEQASEKLLVAVREGGAEATDFAGSLGRVIGISSQVGVSFDEVAASIATFTRLGISADESVTALRGVMTSLLNPTEEGRETLLRFGTSIEQVRAAVRENGLADTLIDLVKLTKDNDDALVDIIPNVRALSGVLGTAGSQGTAYREILDKIQRATKEVGTAFDTTARTGTFKWNQFLASAQVVAIEFGDALAPAFRRALEAASRFLDGTVKPMVEWFGKLSPETQQTAFAMGALAASLGPVIYFTGGLVSAVGELYRALLLLKGVSLATVMGPLAIPLAALGLVATAGYKISTAPDQKKPSGPSGPFNPADFDRGPSGAIAPMSSRSGGTAAAPSWLNEWTRTGATALAPFASHGGRTTTGAAASGGSGPRTSILGGTGGGGGSDLAQQLAAAERAVANLTAAQMANIEAGLKMGTSVEAIAAATHLSEAAVTLYSEQLKDNAEALEIQTETAREAREEMGRVAASIMAVVEAGQGLDNAEWMKGVVAGTTRQFESRAAAVDADMEYADQLSGIASDRYTARAAAAADAPTVKNTLRNVTQQLPGTLVASFTGGGNPAKAVGGMIGSEFGKSFEGPVASLVGKALGKTIGGAIGSVIPFVGGVLGSVIGAGVGKLVGVFGKGEGKKTNDARDKWVEQMGGEEKLNSLMQQAGMTDAEMRKLYSINKVKDFEAAATAVTEKLNAQQAILQKYNVTWKDFTGAEKTRRLADELKGLNKDYDALIRANVDHKRAVEMVAPAYMEMANAALEAGGEITVALGPVLTGFLEITRAGLEAGERIPASLVPVITKLEELGLITAADAELLRSVSAEAGPSFQSMEEAANRYGIALDGLGQRYQQLRLTATAEQIVKDYDLLVEGGAPVNAVLSGMSDEINEIVQNAIKFGIAVPESMRPVLETMLANGLLVDANGDKIRDLGSISFAPSLLTQTEEMVAAFDRLIDVVGGLTEALNNIPRNVTTTVSTVVAPGAPAPVDGAPAPAPAPGGDYGDVTSAANEGMFSSPTLAMVGDAHEPEYVLHKSTLGDLSSQPDEALRREVSGMRRDLRDLPLTLAIALRDAIATQGRF